MATTISLDIGFDRNALAKAGNQNSCLLQCGFIPVGTAGDPDAWARKLRPGYGLVFTLYDLTDPTATESPVDRLSFKIQFQKAQKQSNASPLENPAYGQFEIYKGVQSPGYSEVFQQSFPRWNVHRHKSTGVLYPKNQLVSGKSKGSETNFTLANVGHFYFTLLLSVGWGEETKSFRVDPEIILSNNGP